MEAPQRGPNWPARRENAAVAEPPRRQEIACKVRGNLLQFAASRIENAKSVEPSIRSSDGKCQSFVFGDCVRVHRYRSQAQSALWVGECQVGRDTG